MNKFNEVYKTIMEEINPKSKKIIKEDLNKDEITFFIDLDLNLINQKYCDDGVDLNFIEKNALFFKVNVIKLPNEDNSIRLESSNKQKLIALLGTFINAKEFDYICTFIRNS